MKHIQTILTCTLTLTITNGSSWKKFETCFTQRALNKFEVWNNYTDQKHALKILLFYAEQAIIVYTSHGHILRNLYKSTHTRAFIPCSSLFNRLRMRWDGTVPKNWTELCVEIIYCVIVLLRVPFSCKLSAHYTFHRPFHAGFVCWLTVKWLLCSSIGKAFGRFLENISIQWQRNMRQ